MAKDHVLDNGYTFMAVTCAVPGSWAKATDPITAIRNAALEYGIGSGRKPVVVRCLYGKSEDLWIDHYGSIGYSLESTVTPVGLFAVTQTSIKPLKRGQFGRDHEGHLEWINRFNAEQAEQSKRVPQQETA